MSKLWMFLHLIGVVAWIGGMFFMLFSLRPALNVLEGPQKVKLMLAVQGRFFNWVFVALGLLWLSGVAMMGAAISNGMSPLPIGWHVMAALAAFMTLVFLFIRYVLFPKAHKCLIAQETEELARVMEEIRVSVLVNLGIGVVVMAAAVFGR